MNEKVEFFNEKRIPIESDIRKSGQYPYYGATGIIDYVKDYIFDGEYVLLAEDGANILTRNSPIAYITEGRFWLNNHAHIMQMKFGTNYFLLQLLERKNYEKFNSGTAQPKLNSQVVKNMVFNFPSEEEQSKTGSFFKQLDETITLHQRKLDRLKDLKQAYLQQMFPSEGESVPSVRFTNFNRDWEQRKLEDESIIVAGGDIDKQKISEVGKYPVLANALTNDGIVGYYKEEYRVEAPAVTVTGRGDVGHAQARKFNFTPVVRLLAIKSEHDVDFLESAINNHRVLVESTGVPQLTSPQLGNYKIYFPSFDEERKIGEFLSNFDHLITLHQHKLESLNKLKQAYLQKMFI